GLVFSVPASLIVAVPPAISSQPTNQTVAAGADVNFTVTATGDQPLMFQWYFNRTNIINGATATNYTVFNAQAANSGTYSVVITNSLGSTTSAVATLTVNMIPVITSQPASQTVDPGSSVTFSVTANGSAPLNYQWYFNGTN